MAKVSHMVLPVSDLHQSRDWYVGKLGFVFDGRERGEHVAGIKDHAGLTIFLQKAAGNLAGQKITLTIQVDNVVREEVAGRHASRPAIDDRAVGVAENLVPELTSAGRIGSGRPPTCRRAPQ